MPHPQLGDFVYPSYSPARVGVVVEVRDNGFHPKHPTLRKPVTLTVQTLKGVRYETSELGVGYFRELVADHERKAKNHRETLKALEEMWSSYTE